MKNEQLKPCPQCGSEVRHTDESDYLCIECEMDLSYDYNEWWYSKRISELELQLSDQKELNLKEIERHIELDEKNIALRDVLDKAKELFSHDWFAYRLGVDDLKQSITKAEKVYEKFRIEHEKSIS